MARLKLKHSRPIRRPPKPRLGRGEKGGATFLPDNLQLVRLIAAKGATDDEMAEMVGVSPEVFQRWRKAYPSMAIALDQGRSRVDADVTVSLYKQTQGYEYEEETTAGKDGHIVTLKKYSRPDTRAIEYWLENRRPDLWGHSVRVTGGKKGSDDPVGVKVETRNELIDAIVAMIAPKPDGTTRPESGDEQRVKR